MALLTCESTMDKLNEMSTTVTANSTDNGEECHLNKEPSIAIINGFYQSIKFWLSVSTEQHRKQLSAQIKKNWLRLCISIMVVVVQFLWFASYYLGLNTADTYSRLLMQQLATTTNTKTGHTGANSVSIIKSNENMPTKSNLIYPYSMVDSLIINMNATPDNENDKNNNNKNSLNANGKSNDINLINDNNNEKILDPMKLIHMDKESLYCETLSSKIAIIEHEHWPSFIWRLLLGIKLAFIMLGLELVRLFDTVLEIFRHPKQPSSEDEKNRKSFIDLSYIERNRGYK